MSIIEVLSMVSKILSNMKLCDIVYNVIAHAMGNSFESNGIELRCSCTFPHGIYSSFINFIKLVPRHFARIIHKKVKSITPWKHLGKLFLLLLLLILLSFYISRYRQFVANALGKMNINDVVWNPDATYALGIYKYITWMSGTWPLKNEGLFTMIRFGIAFVLEFGILVSVLMEIRLNCGTTDETLDFFALTAVAIAGLTKLILVKVHRKDLQRILLSALKDWNTLIDNSLEKQILWKYTYRAKFLCRIQMSLGLVIIISMTLDALFAAISFQSVNVNSSEEVFKQTPLRTVCMFGDMTTSAYWIVFVFQTLQVINAVVVDVGNDVFFFGIAMHICSQLHILKIFFDEFKSEDSEDRVKKIDEFVNRHSHVLGLAQKLEDTYNYVLLAVLMANGLHICLAGIHILLVSKQYDIVQLLKTGVAFMVVLAQLFLYNYTGEYLSTLSQDICNIIYHFPWYECSPSTVRNVIFIIMRAHEPLRLTAGKFYTMNLENFKNILKASFSYFSVLRIMFDE